MDVHLIPIFIWNSYSFQTELPVLLGLENKQLCRFLFTSFHSRFRCISTYNNMVKMSIHFHHVYYSYLVVRCCNRKARAAYVQSFTLWQQATIEFTRREHSIIVCSRHICMGDVLRSHSVRGEMRIQRNARGEVATTSPPFYNKMHRGHVLFVKVAPGTTFTSWSQHHFVAIGKPERHVCKASPYGSKQQ